MNYLFMNRNFALKLQGNYWKDDVVTFTAHLSVTIKPLTRYKQKVVLAAMLEGKSMPSNMAAQTNHTTLLNNQNAIKYLLYMRYLSNFWCNIIFKRSAIFFFHQQDSKSLFLRKRWSRDLLVHVAYGTSANRVISLLHTRCILYSLCLPVHHFSQLSVNLKSFLRISKNISHIWSKSVGYAKLLGRFEPIGNG